MTVAGALAAIAVLLGLAAIRELSESLRWRPTESRMATELRRRAGSALLSLNLPARLADAGLASRMPLTALLLGKACGAAIGGTLAWAAAPAAPGRMSLLVAIALPAAGFLAPDALLEREVRRRRRRLIGALPDALDLLAVASSSGRAPVAGFAEIAAGGSGPLAEELRVAVAELSCGCPLPEALRSLRERVPGSEVASLCAAIERSHRLGSPLADHLRRQSSALRRDQRRGVEERAARAAPKIQLVVALILVPSVLLMIAAALIANAGRLLGGL